MTEPDGRREAPAEAAAARRLSVIFLTQYFPPEIGAAPSRAYHFARALAGEGHSVRVITGLPNHPSGIRQPGYRPGDREEREGFRIERSWLFTSSRKTAITRLLSHVTFALTSSAAALRVKEADLVIVTIPPPFVGLTGWLTSLIRKAPLLVDCRDDWPRAIVALGEMRPGLFPFLLDRLAGFLYQRAARVVVVTPGMRRSLSARGMDAGRLALITNGADTETFRPSPIPSRSPGEPLRVLYAGTHGLIHGMEVLLDAAEILGTRRDARFVLVGDGTVKAGLQKEARSRGLDQVEFLPSVPPGRLAELIRESDICVATVRNHAFAAETIPVKLFDYLAAGRPVVACVSGDAADVVRASCGGLVVPPGDAAALAGALDDLAGDAERRAMLGRCGAVYATEHLSRLRVGRALVTLAEEIVRRDRGRTVRAVPAGAYGVVKRALDFAAAAVLFLLLSPLMICIAAAILLDSPGGVFFRQRRTGFGSRDFVMLKFRTMAAGTPDLASHLMGPDAPSVTRIGRFLRRTSLDELPQLFNVLSGRMSLVGPRPALFNQDDLIAMRRASGIDALRPGITGWAQIHGRDDIPLDEKVSLDRYYLDHVSPGLDLKVLVRTLQAVRSSRGVF